MNESLILVFFVTVANKEIFTKAHDTKPTTTCAISIQEYESRSHDFNCTGRTYVCILSKNDQLVETCMWDRRIEPGKAGCPYLVDINDEVGPLIDAKLKTCNVVGCPQENHQGYKLSELYKYPACFLQTNYRTMTKTSTSMVPQEMTNAKGGNGITFKKSQYAIEQHLYIIALIPGCIIIAMLAFCVAYSIKQRKYKDKKADRDIELQDMCTIAHHNLKESI